MQPPGLQMRPQGRRPEIARAAGRQYIFHGERSVIDRDGGGRQAGKGGVMAGREIGAPVDMDVIVARRFIAAGMGRRGDELLLGRSEERRVGKEWRSRWSPEQ